MGPSKPSVLFRASSRWFNNVDRFPNFAAKSAATLDAHAFERPDIRPSIFLRNLLVKLPIWLRIVVVVALVVLAAGASLFAYRWYERPVTLSIAVGSLDGDAPKIVSALASRLAVNNAPVRLKVVETTGPIESAAAF